MLRSGFNTNKTSLLHPTDLPQPAGTEGQFNASTASFSGCGFRNQALAVWHSPSFSHPHFQLGIACSHV